MRVSNYFVLFGLLATTFFGAPVYGQQNGGRTPQSAAQHRTSAPTYAQQRVWMQQERELRDEAGICSCYRCVHKSVVSKHPELAPKIPALVGRNYRAATRSSELNPLAHSYNQPPAEMSEEQLLSSNGSKLPQKISTRNINSSLGILEFDAPENSTPIQLTNSETNLQQIKHIPLNPHALEQSLSDIIETDSPTFDELNAGFESTPRVSPESNDEWLNAHRLLESEQAAANQDSAPTPARDNQPQQTTVDILGERVQDDSLLLRASTEHPGKFLNSFTGTQRSGRRQADDLTPTRNSGYSPTQPLVMEPVNIRPLPAINPIRETTSAVVAPIDVTARIVTPEMDMKHDQKLDITRNHGYRDLVPLQKPEPQIEEPTQLPTTASQKPLMVQTSSRKRHAELAPVTPSPAEIPPPLHQQSSAVASPILNDFSDTIRLHATTAQSVPGLPPIINIKTSATTMSSDQPAIHHPDDSGQIEALKQRLERLESQSFRNIVETAPMVDGQVSEAIRRLTVRPQTDNNESKTIDR